MSEANARTVSFNVAGVSINIGSMRHAVSVAIADAKHGRGFCLFTLNLDHCVKLRASPQFQEAYRHANYVAADGFPIVLLGKLNGMQVRRTTGADLVEPLCAQAARHRIPIFLLGPSTRVLERAQARLARQAADLIVAGSYAPGSNFDPESNEADIAIERIRRSGARLCFMALGAPRQEIFSARCRSLLPDAGFICVGASLDFLAGNQTRAPRFFREHGLEWLWRLLSDPRRLATRYLRCAAIFPRLAAEVIPQAISARLGRI